MTPCPDCQRAERDPLHAIYGRGPCCDARRLLAMPARLRRPAAQALRDAVPAEHWQAVRTRIEVLRQLDSGGPPAANASGTHQNGLQRHGATRTGDSASKGSPRRENRGQIKEAAC